MELSDLEVAEDPYMAAAGAHVVVLATAWPDYQRLDWARMREAMFDVAVVDARNALDGDAVIAAGLDYHAVGRTPRVPRDA